MENNKYPKRGKFLRLIYFFYWAATASLIPYIGLHYQIIGLNGFQIGVLYSIPSFILFLSSIIFSYIADLTRSNIKLIRISIIGLIISIILLFNAKDFNSLLLVISTYAFFTAPINPLIDKMVLDVLGNHKEKIGGVRIGGSIGWGSSVLLTGLVIKILSLNCIFYCYIIMIIFCFITSLLIPDAIRKKDRIKKANLKTLLAKKKIITILLGVLIWGVSEASITHFLFLYMNSLDASALIMGLSMSFAIISEMASFYLIRRLIIRFGNNTIFFAGFVFQLIRLLSLSLFNNVGLILITQLIGGTSFALIWASSVSYIDEMAPRGTKTIAQGLRSGFQHGLGSAFGALVGGFFYMTFGTQKMFGFMALFVLFGLVGGFFLLKPRQ